MERTPSEWSEVLQQCGVSKNTALKWSPIFSEAIHADTFSKGDAEIDDFLGQILHESQMLEKLEEGLFYSSPERLCAVWPKRFPTPADAAPYVRNPQKLANHVYANRMGNGDEASGDGWRNRGSGLIQITGADNLRSVQKATGIPVYDHPELLRQPSIECLQVCIAWWEKNVPDGVMGNIEAVTRKVNGGTVGLADRRHLTDEAGDALS